LSALRSSTQTGERYKRAAHNESQIREALSRPPAELPAQACHLENEVLVFLIERTHGVKPAVCGALMQELQQRIRAGVLRYTQELDQVDQETVSLNVEMRIFELILIKKVSRKRDFLQVAFGQAMQRLAMEELEKLANSPMGNVTEIAPVRDEDDDEEIERPIELVADEGPGPEDILLNLDDTNARHRLLRKACKAVPDRRKLRAVILHYCQDIPISSARRGEQSLSKIFRKDPDTIKHWISTAMRQMRAALGVQRQRTRKS
jgi:hypothetical protein